MVCAYSHRPENKSYQPRNRSHLCGCSTAIKKLSQIKGRFSYSTGVMWLMLNSRLLRTSEIWSIENEENAITTHGNLTFTSYGMHVNSMWFLNCLTSLASSLKYIHTEFRAWHESGLLREVDSCCKSRWPKNYSNKIHHFSIITNVLPTLLCTKLCSFLQKTLWRKDQSWQKCRVT